MKAFNGIDYEKQWHEFLEESAKEYQDQFAYDEAIYDNFVNGANWMRRNLSHLPEVRELIERIKILKGYLKETYTEDWEPEYQAARDLESLIKKLEGEK